MSQTPRPSRAGYWIGAALGVAGLAVGILLLVLSVGGVAREIERLERVPVPGQTVLSLAAGEHAIYQEGVGNPPLPGAVTVTVQDAGGGQPIPLRPFGMPFTYEAGGRSGRGANTFRVARDGRYRVTAGAAPNSGAGVMVGPPLPGKLVPTVFRGFAGIALLIGGPALGLIAVIVTAVRRRPRDPTVAAGSEAAAAAGWYPDPWGQSPQRWWDGRRWTGHTQ